MAVTWWIVAFLPTVSENKTAIKVGHTARVVTHSEKLQLIFELL